MSYYRDITSPYIWTLLQKGQALSYRVVCVLHSMFCGRNLLRHQQWIYRHNHLIATSAIPLSFQVSCNLPVLSRQEQRTTNLCPFPTVRTCLHRKIWWRKSCSTAPTFAFLRIDEWRTRQWLVLCVQSQLSRVQLHTMSCSNDLEFWTVYYYKPHVFFRHWGSLLQCVGFGP